MTWTPDRIELLTQLWKEGHSCSQIALKLQGVSRNAVIGKVTRLGLAKRPTPVRPIKPPKFNRAPNLRLRAVVFTSGAPLNVSVMDLQSQMCRWPVSEDRPHKFCGHTTEEGKPYCPDHMKQAHGEHKPKKIRAPHEFRVLEIAA